MKTSKLKASIKKKIMADPVLLGKLSQALGISSTGLRYRLLPADDERFTFPRIQTIIREHLGLSADTIITSGPGNIPTAEHETPQTV